VEGKIAPEIAGFFACPREYATLSVEKRKSGSEVPLGTGEQEESSHDEPHGLSLAD
jgi:hypothetical protein